MNDKRLTYSKNKLYLDQRENTILVDYGLSKANFSKEILFRHRLDRNDWSNWTNKTTTRYSNLTSGSHRIEVEAKNVTDLNAISQIDSVEFEVDIALYQEPYFNKLLGLLILSLILAGYFFYRNYKLEKRIVQLLQTEKDKLIFEKNELTTLNENLINKIQSISKIDLVNAKQKIDITTPSKIISHKPNDITYIVAEKSGIRVYTTQGDYWSDMTIKQFVSKSSDKRFIRVYRSTVVNVSHIKWVNHVSLMMQDGSEHKIGRTYKKDIMAAFEED